MNFHFFIVTHDDNNEAYPEWWLEWTPDPVKGFNVTGHFVDGHFIWENKGIQLVYSYLFNYFLFK